MRTRSIHKFITNYFPTLILFLIIVYLSLGRISAPRSMPKIPHLDKVVHFLIYFVFTHVLSFDLFRSKNRLVLVARRVLGLFLPIVLGVTMELAQVALTVYRSGDFLDILFNTLGAVAGLLVFIYLVEPKLAVWLSKKSESKN